MLADRILFIDGEAIVVDKPAGLPVETPRDASVSVESHLDMLRFGFQRKPSIVHRLDCDTSGALLLARSERAHKRFAQTFEAGTVGKTYVAVLEGVLEGEDGVVELALAKVSTKADGWRMIPAKKGKPARTRWRLLGQGDGRALVRFEPETGRTHQLRVHAASGLGLPIVGDPVYGTGRTMMLLHALSLTVPREGKAAIDATAPLPPHFPGWAHALV